MTEEVIGIITKVMVRSGGLGGLRDVAPFDLVVTNYRIFGINRGSTLKTLAVAGLAGSAGPSGIILMDANQRIKQQVKPQVESLEKIEEQVKQDPKSFIWSQEQVKTIESKGSTWSPTPPQIIIHLTSGEKKIFAFSTLKLRDKTIELFSATSFKDKVRYWGSSAVSTTTTPYQQSTQQAPPHICSSCGAPIEPGNVFCGTCGRKV